MKTIKIMLVATIALLLGVAPAHAQLKKDEAEVTFTSNMTCAHCKAKVEKNIPFEKGVEDLKVDVAANTIYIKYNTTKTSVEQLQKAIAKIGYQANLPATNQDKKQE